ncbi:hypothetical protein D0T49_05500 [Paludibacter sp. 221]|uniref:glycoside hydrolase family 16 protein n=1 Tax=Paludibacter sp. 221 TaxID=2302939 RepID=UPI0013D708AC|nr:family 16 glycosylhydrolase [Paludibacter sp. 221]NDV46496.1 hypothetical protein [Paludibacter sp. 221]
MNLFWKKLFGKLTSTAKFETELNQFQTDMERYFAVKESVELSEYKDLSRTLGSVNIKEEKKKLEKAGSQDTDEYKKIVRFETLKNNIDIQFYLRQKPDNFETYYPFKKSFSEEFDWNVLSKSNWNFGFYQKSPSLIGDYSLVNEKQANNSGENISVFNGVLRLATNHEKVKARAWDATKGFIEREYEYTSDIMQSGAKFSQKYGIFQAKIRCTGKINHAFWLASEDRLPLVEVFHYDGKAIKLGVTDKKGKAQQKIAGLNPSGFFIYTLMWSEKEMVWMINNQVVYRTSNHIPHEKMYLGFNSFIAEKQKAAKGLLEVDWVRVYSK